MVNNLTDFPAAAPYTEGLCATGKTGGVGNGVCTLRAAIMEANHWPSSGDIYLASGGSLTLNYSDPVTVRL